MAAPSPTFPTLIVGLGAFGRDVLELSMGGSAHRYKNIVRIQDAPADEVAKAAVDALRDLLDLSHFVSTTDATDTRGPRCDALLVADLSEEGVAPRVAAVAEALAGQVRRAYRAILADGDGAFSVCPLLAMPAGTPEAIRMPALDALRRAAAGSKLDRLGGRVYLVEDQSGKYVLSRAELSRSFAAFLQLLLLSRLRDREGGARDLMELPPDDRAIQACFATFSCATLLFDDDALAGRCAARLAGEVLHVLRAGGLPTIEEIGAEATRLAPARHDLETELWREGGGRGQDTSLLSKHLAPPSLPVPEIAWEDSPEDIVEVKLGPLWRASIHRQIQAFRDEVERFKMDRLVSEIEHRGKALGEKMTKKLADWEAEEVGRGPRGHARALEILRETLSRTRADLAAISKEIEAPDLNEFPASPLDSKLDAVRVAAFARPRHLRLFAFGTLAAIAWTVLFAGVLIGALRFLAAPEPPFFDFATSLPEELPWALGRGIVPFVIGAVLAASSVTYRLYKHRKRHHNWVTLARAELDQALKRHVERDIVGYFSQRLYYTTLLWEKRLLRAYAERIESAIRLLESIRASLGHAEHRIGQEERRLDDRLDEATHRAGILLRGVVAKRDAAAVYQEVRPPDVAAVAERWLKKSLAAEAEVLREAGREPQSAFARAPFADPEALAAFCRKELGELGGLSSFERPSPTLAASVDEALRAMLRQLAQKLSAPLAVVEHRATPGSAAEKVRRMAVIPASAAQLFEGALATENLAGGWEVLPISEDPHRVHLLVVRTDLDLTSLAATGTRAGSEAGAPRGRGAG